MRIGARAEAELAVPKRFWRRSLIATPSAYGSGKIQAAISGKRRNSEMLMDMDRKSFARFRRHNRDLIKTCLTRVLSGSERAEEEAEQRINTAIECDFLDTEE